MADHVRSDRSRCLSPGWAMMSSVQFQRRKKKKKKVKINTSGCISERNSKFNSDKSRWGDVFIYEMSKSVVQDSNQSSSQVWMQMSSCSVSLIKNTDHVTLTVLNQTTPWNDHGESAKQREPRVMDGSRQKGCVNKGVRGSDCYCDADLCFVHFQTSCEMHFLFSV